MKSTIANTLDLEINLGEIIEIGITTIDLTNLQILKSYDMPIINIQPIEKEITELTGWTDAKLKRQGIPLEKALARIAEKYGPINRLLVVDQATETEPFETQASLGKESYDPFGKDRVNVSSLYKIVSGDHDDSRSLKHMLRYFGMEFEGTLHRAHDDSKNIARLFIAMMKCLQEGYHHPRHPDSH